MKYMTKAEEIVDIIFTELSVFGMINKDNFDPDDIEGIKQICADEIQKIIDPLGTALRGKEEIRHQEKLYPSDWDIY
jgi:hypothetical protein